MALMDVIRFDGLRSRDWLIYKYYSEELTLGSQLIVQEGQVAIFVSNGAVCDVFYPGTYTLVTDNIPLLQTIINIPFGRKSPFSAEVYYVNTAVKLDINWGTTDPIQLIDPKYYVKLRVRAFGQLGLCVSDPVTLFKEVIGGMQKAEIVKFDSVKEYFRGLMVIKVKAAIANEIIAEKISALEISVKLEELSGKIKEQIDAETGKYGLGAVNFYIQSINFPDEDFEKINKILEDKAAFEIMGDSRYATKRSFDVYEGAATNPNGMAGMFAAGGMGMLAGKEMGMTMEKTVGNPMQRDDTRVCHSCQARIPVGTKFCPECGANFSKVQCECGASLAAGTRFCPECGKKL